MLAYAKLNPDTGFVVKCTRRGLYLQKVLTIPFPWEDISRLKGIHCTVLPCNPGWINCDLAFHTPARLLRSQGVTSLGFFQMAAFFPCGWFGVAEACVDQKYVNMSVSDALLCFVLWEMFSMCSDCRRGTYWGWTAHTKGLPPHTLRVPEQTLVLPLSRSIHNGWSLTTIIWWFICSAYFLKIA